MAAQKIVVDTDIGTYYDDALAVLLAARSPELEFLGVTTVYGDTELRSRIARKVLDVAGRDDVPVATGVGTPIRGDALMFGFEGEGILEGPDDGRGVGDEHAVDLLIRTVLASPGEVTIVTLGAVTNVALAILKEPRFAAAVGELIMMGGVIVPIVDESGVRRSPVEEYNLNNDPIAAQIVFDSEVRKTLCPIDVTLKVPLTQEQIARIDGADDPVAQQVSRILAAWPTQERLIYVSVGIATEYTGLWLHDPLTVGLAHSRDFCDVAALHVAAEFAPTPIDRDLIVRDDILRTIPKKRPANMDVCLDVDGDRFTAHFTDRICGTE